MVTCPKQKAEVTKDFATHVRYVRFLKVLELDRDPNQCNQGYLAALGQAVFPLPHAEEVCRAPAKRGHYLYMDVPAFRSFPLITHRSSTIL